MLSHATHETGRGWGFGLHEAMDQIGALLGPLVVAAVLYRRGGYQTGFAVLLIPALLALSVLIVGRCARAEDDPPGGGGRVSRKGSGRHEPG
jgi:MFS family permease